MATTRPISTITSFPQVASSSAKLFSVVCRQRGGATSKSGRIRCMLSVPADMGRRQMMNMLLTTIVALPTAGILVPYAFFFVPPGSGDDGGSVTAKDGDGNDVVFSEWLKSHGPGDRTLVQGLMGDPTYVVVGTDGNLAAYGVNAVCTHLGCVVPWNAAENKFICPCHGSQYDGYGEVVKGPAPLSLALAHADVEEGKVVLVPWVETDFRTGEKPWWV